MSGVQKLYIAIDPRDKWAGSGWLSNQPPECEPGSASEVQHFSIYRSHYFTPESILWLRIQRSRFALHEASPRSQ